MKNPGRSGVQAVREYMRVSIGASIFIVSHSAKARFGGLPACGNEFTVCRILIKDVQAGASSERVVARHEWVAAKLEA